MQDDSHVVPVDWPAAEPDTEDESHAGPDQAVPGSDEAKDAASAGVPVAPRGKSVPSGLNRRQIRGKHRAVARSAPRPVKKNQSNVRSTD